MKEFSAEKPAFSLPSFSKDWGPDLPIRRNPRNASFSSLPLLAGIVDPEQGRVYETLRSGKFRNLEQALGHFESKPETLKLSDNLRKDWGPFLEELVCLSQEPDRETLYYSLLEFGGRLQRDGAAEKSARVYAALVGEQAAPQEVREKAQEQFQAVTGGGSGWRRFGYSLSQLPEELTHVTPLMAMTGAGLAFKGTRLALSLRWGERIESAWVLNAATTSAAFAAETVAFTGLEMGLGELGGVSQDWSAKNIYRHWGSGAATLLGLKASGWAVRSGVARVYEGSTVKSLSRTVTEKLAPQLGMFTGVLAGNRIAESQGFHEAQHGDSWLVTGAASVIRLNAVGVLQQRMNVFKGLELSAEIYRGQLEARGGSPSNWNFSSNFGPKWATPEGLRISAIGEENLTIRNKTQIFRLADDSQVAGTKPAGNENSVSGNQRRVFPLGILETTELLSFTSDFKDRLYGLPSETRLVEVFVDCKGLKTVNVEKFREFFANLLFDRPSLREIRVQFSDGKLIYAGRDSQRRLYGNHAPVAEMPKIENQIDFDKENTQIFFLTSPDGIGNASQTLWSHFFSILRTRSKLSRQEVADLINHKTGSKIDGYDIGRIENHGTDFVSFEKLCAFAEMFGVAKSDLIEILNLSHYRQGLYEGIHPKDWQLQEYPIYIETSADLERLHLYQKIDPKRESLAWLVYSSRKNPENYLDLPALEEKGISVSTTTKLELNHLQYLSLPYFQKLSVALNVSLHKVLDAANRTRHADLELDKLFPGHSIYLEPYSDDVAKIRSYRQTPGTLGELFFFLRHIQEGFLSVEEISRRVKRDHKFWQDCERNRVTIDKNNWQAIVATVGLLGGPIEKLAVPLKGIRLKVDSPEVLIAYGLAGESIIGFNERTGIHPSTIEDIISPASKKARRVLEPETILRLQLALPRLRGDLLYMRMHPEVKPIFGPIDPINPVLNLEGISLAQAMDFHLGTELFDYRMGYMLDTIKMENALGVPRRFVFDQETRVIDFIDPSHIATLARTLEVDPRLIYLHYHPQILLLFPVSTSANSDHPARVSPETYQRLIERKAAHRDSSNRRDQLRKAMASHGIKDERGLASFLGMGDNEMNWFQKDTNYLDHDKMIRITAAFPELSYRDWYEHFNLPALEYFLGRKADDSIDYSIPGNLSAAELENIDLAKMFKEQVVKIYGSYGKAFAATRITALKNSTGIEETIRTRNWRDIMVVRMADALQIDRRLLYMFMKLPELRPMLEEESVAPSHDQMSPLPTPSPLPPQNPISIQRLTTNP